MVTADSHLKNYFRSSSVRDMVISMISDDYKDMHGFRPRYNYAAMNLVELWAVYRSLRCNYWREVEARDSEFEYWEEIERQESAERDLMAEVSPNHWDHVADRLEGIRIS